MKTNSLPRELLLSHSIFILEIEFAAITFSAFFITPRNIGNAIIPRIENTPITVINSIKLKPSFDLIDFF